MFAALRHRFARVRGLVWFNKFDSGVDWPLDSWPAIEAFSRELRRGFEAERLRRAIGTQPDPATAAEVSSLYGYALQTRHLGHPRGLSGDYESGAAG